MPIATPTSTRRRWSNRNKSDKVERTVAIPEVRSLSRWERVGVRGYGLSLEQRPLTRIAEFIIGRRFAPTRWQSDLSPKGEK
jgi:hypothetical protein